MADGHFIMAGGNVFRMRGPREIRSQCGAICWRREADEVQVLLVTSRDTGRWVIPKGGQIDGLDDPGSAAQEAWEEAGVRGTVLETPLGHYTYRKGLRSGSDVDCDVAVFALKVREIRDRFPEEGQRDRRWFTPAAAALRVCEPDLSALLASFSPPADTNPDSLPLRPY